MAYSYCQNQGITIVLYLGADSWDGPLSLHDMLAVQDPEILALVPNYTMNLVQPAAMTDADIARFHTELGQVMHYIRCSNDMDKLYEITHSDDRFKRLSPESADLLNSATGSRLVIPEKERKEGKINMCLAIDKMRRVSEEKGIAIGNAQGEARGTLNTRAEDISNVMDSFGVSMADAMTALHVDPQVQADVAKQVKLLRS